MGNRTKVTIPSAPKDLPDRPAAFHDQASSASIWFLISCVFVLFSYSRIERNISSGEPHTLWYLVGIALFFLVLGLFMDRPGRIGAGIHAVVQRSCRSLEIDPSQVAFLLIALGCAVVAAAAAGGNAYMRDGSLAVGAWMLSISLAVLGTWRSSERLGSIRRRPLLLATFFILIAFLLRSFDTQNIPRVLTGDEGSVGLSALDFMHGRFDNLFAVGWFDFPALYFYIQSLSIRVFGQSIPALRLTSALVGAFTVGAVYLAGRYLFGQATGILAAVFLAGFHFHVHFSRLGINNIWDAFFFILAFGSLWYGWLHEKRSAYIFTGAAVGLGQYFYVSSRLMLLIIPVWLVLMACFDLPRFKRNRIHFLPMFFTGLMVVFPLLVYFAARPMRYLEPINRVSILGEWAAKQALTTASTPQRVILEHMVDSLLSFTSLPVQMFYAPGTPILRPLPAGLFLAGLVLLLRHWRDGRSLLLLLWLLAIAVPAGLSYPGPAAQRYVAASPAIALLIAYPMARLADVLSRFSTGFRISTLSLGICFCAVLSLDDLRFYYLDFTLHKDFSDTNTWVAHTLAEDLQTRDPNWQVVFFGMPRMAYHSIASLRYLAPHIQGHTAYYPPGAPGIPPFAAGSKLLFVFLQDHLHNLEQVEQAYPGGRLQEIYYPNGIFLYWKYTYDGSEP